jgi:transposase
MKRFSLSQEEYEQIRRAERRTRDKNVSRRLRVLMLRYEGRALSEIAAKMGMQINSISQMCRRYREQGLEEFMRNKYTSHRYALPKEKENELLALFEKRIREGGEVSAAEIKAAFDEARGKDTGRGYIYMLLKRHGWKALRKKAKPGKAGEKTPKTGNQVCWAPARTGTK